MVDRKAPLPAWAQVERDIRSLIDQGLQVGSQIPPENELAAIYGVSRITVRQALSSLSDHGFVERRQGTGTFVADRPQLVQHDLGLTAPWRDRFQAAGHRAESIQVKETSVEMEPYELTRGLTEEEQAANRLHFKRLHRVDDRPIGLTDSWLVEGISALKQGDDLIDGSLSRTLERLGVASFRMDHFLEVGLASVVQAELLETDVDAPLFIDWSTNRREDGSLVETSRTIWLGTRVRFHYTSDLDAPHP
nr:GntR family transcriptional regulator [Arthrobacter sp. efr-133-R2A-120]